MDVQHKEDEFFIEIDGKKALLNYRITEKKMDIFHTFTPEELRGRGLAEQLTKAAFDYAKKHRMRVIPTCLYVRDTFLVKHPEMKNVAEQG